MESPTLAVDIIIELKNSEIVLIRRGKEPYKGMLALPGGRVEIGETVEQAAIREAIEETGLEIKLSSLHGVYSDPDRDPRRHTVSVVFRAIRTGGSLKASTDAAEIMKTNNFLSLDLAFDHKKILKDAFQGVG